MKKLLTALAFLLFASPASAAIQLSSYTVPTTGVAAPYWVIAQVTLNPLKNTILVGANGYISSTAYADGLKPATIQNFTISGSTYTAFLAAVTSTDIPSGTTQGAVVTELLGALYTNMLTLSFFSGGTIVP